MFRRGVSCKGFTSRPPVPEECEVNRLHTEAVNKQKEAVEAAADRKRRRKEKHDKACKIARAEGKPRPATPESTDEEEDTSDAEVNLPGDDEAATGTDSPPVYQGAGDEDAPVTLREVRPTPGLLVDPPPRGGGAEVAHASGGTKVAHAGGGWKIVYARDRAGVAPADDG